MGCKLTLIESDPTAEPIDFIFHKLRIWSKTLGEEEQEARYHDYYLVFAEFLVWGYSQSTESPNPL